MDRPTRQYRPAAHTELLLRAKAAQLSNHPPAVWRHGTRRTSNQHAQVKRDALLQLLQIGGLGLGGGVAGRSLLGLSRLFQHPDPAHTTPMSTLGPVRPEIHLPGRPDRDRDREKLSASGQGPPADMMQYFANMLPDISTSKPLGDWWGPSAALGTGAATLGGGYAITDWLLSKEQKRQRQQNLEQAEQDYKQSLADEYRTAMLAKQAGDDLGVDSLYEALQSREKQAVDRDPLSALYSPLGNDTVQQFKGWLLAGMLATGAGTGYAMYNHTSNKSRQKILDRAMQARARRRALMSPAPPLTVVDHEEMPTRAA